MTATPRHRWTRGLEAWYVERGRHHLPWRRTNDPWAVLVSEVMLQQTSVARVLPRWERFLSRWPTPQHCAGAPLADVLREWDGLGYPRRARALRDTAEIVAVRGWPADEPGLRALPGVGAYTARAVLAFAMSQDTALPPRDVNLGRVAARAALARDPGAARPGELDACLAAGRPPRMPMRDYAFALFDVGALVCRARATDCAACPLVCCRSRGRPPGILDRPQRRTLTRPTPYSGSLRRLRGEVLRALLSDCPPATMADLSRRVHAIPAASRPGAVAEAVAGLVADGLLPYGPPSPPTP